MLPTLRCAGCTNQIVLPYRTFQNSPLLEPYWPEDSKRLSWVCSVCLHCTSYSHHQIAWAPEEQFAKPHPDRGFWRIAIACESIRCAAPIIAYTDTVGRTTPARLGGAVATASPVPHCHNGHAPGSNRVPSELDFIEWIGDVEYLH